jgi:hypothetical protein
MKISDIVTKITELLPAEQLELLKAIPQGVRPMGVAALLEIFTEIGTDFKSVWVTGVIAHSGTRFPLLALGMPELIITHSALSHLYPDLIY